MKRVIIESEQLLLSSVNSDSIPVFVTKNGVLAGMFVHEPDNGWILRVGGCGGCSGHYSSIEHCAKSAVKYGYELFIEE